MKPHSRPQLFPSRRDREPRGFALISILVILSLMGLLAVGMLTLSSITSRQTSASQSLEIARDNARFALLEGLSELQLELGPDQRINANAMLQQSGDGDDATGRWVGVYDSWKEDPQDPDSNDRPAPQFRRWLVSGPESLVRSPNASAPGGDDSVVMAERTSPNGQRSERARAGLVDITSTSGGVGRFAWWVDDEGSKARIDQSINHDSEDIATHFAAAQSTPAANHQIIEKLSTLERDDPRLSRLISQETTEILLSGDQSNDEKKKLPPGFNDFLTPYSAGVQADVRRGGLKRDLSQRLADPANSNLTASDLDSEEHSLYQVNGRGGINFRELHSFFTLPDQLTTSNSRPSAGGSALRNVPSLVRPKSFPAVSTSVHTPYLQPTVLNAGYIIGAKKKVENGRELLTITQDFICTFWNPYDVNIEIGRPTHLTMRIIGLPYEFNLRAGSNQVKTNTRAMGTPFLSFQFGSGRPMVLKPGEVLIGSDASRSEVDNLGSNVANRRGEFGWRNTAGFTHRTGLDITGTSVVRVRLEPGAFTGQGTSGGSIMAFLKVIGSDLVSGGPQLWSGGLVIDRIRDGETRFGLENGDFDDNRSSTFPTIVKNIRVSDLSETGLKVPIAYIGIAAKTELDTDGASRHMSRFNPAYLGYDFQNFASDTLQTMPVEIIAERINSLVDLPLFDVDNRRSFFGGSMKANGGSPNVITHTVPRSPIFSLGALQHAHTNGTKHLHLFGFGSTVQNTFFHDRILHPHVNHAIGNSFAVPCIDAEKTTGTFNSYPAADHSYLANRELWDSWFFSSIHDQTANEWNGLDQSRTAEETFSDFAGINGTPEPLPNPAFVYVGGDPKSDLAKIRKSATEGYDQTASVLLNKGSFNVNTADARAWEALLSSLSGRSVPRQSLTGGNVEWEEATIPVLGKPVTHGDGISTEEIGPEAGGEFDPNQWVGFRNLEQSEIKELSLALVEEVRARGPFLNLGDFINRRLDGELEHMRMGPLQAALDQSINKDIATGPRSNEGRSQPAVTNPDADTGARSTGSSAYVRQADILTTIGPSLSARSDTFVIRGYGEHRNTADGPILARAYCEAVVQRFPDYVEADDNDAHERGGDLTEVNTRLGRKFRILSFKYLDEDDL